MEVCGFEAWEWGGEVFSSNVGDAAAEFVGAGVEFEEGVVEAGFDEVGEGHEAVAFVVVVVVSVVDGSVGEVF